MTPVSPVVAPPSTPVAGNPPPAPTTGAGVGAGTSTGGTLPVAPVLPPAIPAAGAPGDVLLLDDFEDGDTRGWIVASNDGVPLGEWAVVETEEGRAYAQSDDSFDDDAWAVGGNVAWTDIQLDTRFRFTAAANIEDAVAMFAVRFQSKEKYYYVEYRGDGSVKIRKRFDGSEPELASEDLERTAVLGEWIDLVFRARGTSLAVLIDGVAVGSELVDADLGSGGIGLGVSESSAVEFDDVRVTVP
jgi:hypothetical protein